MTSVPRAASGALGGKAGEDGAELRARVGALLATAVMRASSLEDVGLAIPGQVAIELQAESDDPVDDLVLRTESGSRVFVQVKRSVGLTGRRGTPLQKATSQFARAVRAGLDEGDRLVLACARPTRDITHLGEVLARGQLSRPGAPTDREAKALATFEQIAGDHMGPAEFVILLKRLVIWRTDPTHGDDQALLVARLEGTVVADGHGLRAARELSDIVRKLARVRSGHDAVQLTQALRARGIMLRPDAPSTSPVAWAEQLSSFRARAIRHGTTLRLFGVPDEWADLPFDDADARISVSVPEDDRSTLGHPIELAFRRRGRALLVGPPGGGKSTALRSMAAHCAERPDWPLPICAHLRLLASKEQGVMDAILDAAVDHLPPTARPALRSGLSHELERGRCVLVLDGLDEIPRGRRAFVDDLDRLLSDLPPATEVLVATRPSALPDGRRLGLPELTLRPPDRPQDTVNAILTAAAPDREREAWIAQREHWVDAAMSRDPALR